MRCLDTKASAIRSVSHGLGFCGALLWLRAKSAPAKLPPHVPVAIAGGRQYVPGRIEEGGAA